MINCIIFIVIILFSGCTWDQLLVNDPSAKPEPSETREQQAEYGALVLEPETRLPPGHYRSNAPESGKPFLVYIPEGYASKRSYPLIFCYHGAGGDITTWPFYEVTGGNGFIILGMEYIGLDAGRRTPQWVRREKAQFFEVLEMVSKRLNIDPDLIFMGGYSQGGYHTTLLGEQVLDKLAGLIILGAGRFFIDHTPPGRNIGNKPVFIGVGEKDEVHNPRAKRAAGNYKRWGADVTFEEWAGVGHGIGTPVFPSKILLSWMEDIIEKQGAE